MGESMLSAILGVPCTMTQFPLSRMCDSTVRVGNFDFNSLTTLHIVDGPTCGTDDTKQCYNVQLK